MTQELKETLEKRIERFNPREPLFLLIDYFRVRFPTTDALKIIRDVLQLKADYMLYEDYGKLTGMKANMCLATSMSCVPCRSI